MNLPTFNLNGDIPATILEAALEADRSLVATRAALRAGLSDAAAVSLLQSKHPRWAEGNTSRPYGRFPARDWAQYLVAHPDALADARFWAGETH